VDFQKYKKEKSLKRKIKKENLSESLLSLNFKNVKKFLSKKQSFLEQQIQIFELILFLQNKKLKLNKNLYFYNSFS